MLLASAAHATSPSKPLNDTGIHFCAGSAADSGKACDADAPPGQDAQHGRDALARAGSLSKSGNGHASFDFSKISNAGEALPADATLGSGPDDWACTRDNLTGLIWEVKLDDAGHLRHQEHTYSWFNSASADGNPGVAGKSRTCRNTLSSCNSDRFVQAVNAAQLCGASDWRLPSLKELESIINYGQSNPSIDPTYFPNTPALPFWTSNTLAQESNKTWIVSFADAYIGYYYRFFTAQLRLVRENQ